MAFTKAVKSQTKLRAAIFGPSGAGKTFSALAIATGMGNRIALIDSERSSASKYADRYEFDTLDLVEKNIDEYVAGITEAGKAGYDVLIIDSLSHAWQELLADNNALAKAKYKGNTWSAWSDGTPKQHKLVDAILSYPGHVIATMRSKTEWETVKNERGKSEPVRVGLAPEQGKGIEYEFDLLLEMSTEHIANVIKDRTGKFQDKLLEKPGVEFGKQLVAWLSEGAAIPIPQPNPEQAPPAPAQPSAQNKPTLSAELASLVTSTIGAYPTFTEAEKADYRKAFDAAKERHDTEALRDIVARAKAAHDAIYAQWEADGRPMPRIVARAKAASELAAIGERIAGAVAENQKANEAPAKQLPVAEKEELF